MALALKTVCEQSLHEIGEQSLSDQSPVTSNLKPASLNQASHSLVVLALKAVCEQSLHEIGEQSLKEKANRGQTLCEQSMNGEMREQRQDFMRTNIVPHSLRAPASMGKYPNRA